MHGEGWHGGWWFFGGHGLFGVLIWIVILLAVVWLVKEVFKK